MVVVTVELWPHGEKSRRRTLACGIIANDGTGTDEVGNYVANFSLAEGRKWTRDARLGGYPRKRLNVWHLIQRALKEALKQ